MTSEEIAIKVKEIIVKRLNLRIDPSTIENDAPIFLGSEVAGGKKGLGLDSVDTMELVVGISNEFDITITDDDMAIFECIEKIVEFIGTQRDKAQ